MKTKEYALQTGITRTGQYYIKAGKHKLLPTKEFRPARKGDWVLDETTQGVLIYKWDESQECNCPHIILKPL